MADKHKYQAVFDFVPALYPIVLGTLTECGLNGPNFFILSYIRHFGRSTSGGHGVILGELEHIVAKLLGLSISSASRRITNLINDEYLRKIGLTQKERKKVFPFATGDAHTQNTIAILTANGEKSLDTVNDRTVELIDSLIGDRAVPSALVNPALGLLNMVLPVLNERVKQLGRSHGSGVNPASSPVGDHDSEDEEEQDDR